MDVKKLEQLLREYEPEDLKLDLKQKLHAIHHTDKKVQQAQWNELIKDILALANGNVGTSGQPGYLIIGIADKLNEYGTRDLYDVGELNVTSTQILHKVNSACSPPLPDLRTKVIEYQRKRILVITIPPTPHLHETTKPLKTPGTTYQEHTVFIRRKEGIGLASTAERQAIQREKQNSIHQRSQKRQETEEDLRRSGQKPHLQARLYSLPLELTPTNKLVVLLVLSGILASIGIICVGIIFSNFFLPLSSPTETSAQETNSTVSEAVVNPVNTGTPNPTATLTPTPVPSYTNTPVVPPTDTPTIVVLPTVTPTLVPPTAPIPTPTFTTLPEEILISPVDKSMIVDNWNISVKRIEITDQMTFDQQLRKPMGRFLLLFMNITNLGLIPDTFTAYGTVEVQDEEGITYEEDSVVSFWAYVEYDTDIGAQINPDATEYVVAVFDIPKRSETYTLVPGSLAKKSEGSISLEIP
ncbi:MAG: putative DNA binding domain-containing protein [Anaerolineae bacterium]|nr:putative DNA binding domain-containing protein [Anaerolineae bacterium]